LTIGGTAVNSGGSIIATPGTAYAINEAGLTGYAFVDITGTGCPTELGGTVTIAAGQSVTCTIANQDIAPTLALNKTVSNLNGGSASEDDFVLSATPTTGTTITDAGGDVAATDAVSNVTYTLSETTQPGYTASAWTCTGATLVGDTVTLDEGAVASCSITNTDSKNDPSGTTTMAWTVHDSAAYTIRSGPSDAATATIDFKLYSDALCATQISSTESVTVTVNGAGTEASAETVTGYDVGVGTYYWRTFYSGDGFNNPASSACGTEVTTITDSAPPPPTP
jgi:large repetitive protein